LYSKEVESLDMWQGIEGPDLRKFKYMPKYLRMSKFVIMTGCFDFKIISEMLISKLMIKISLKFNTLKMSIFQFFTRF